MSDEDQQLRPGWFVPAGVIEPEEYMKLLIAVADTPEIVFSTIVPDWLEANYSTSTVMNN